MTTSQLRDYYVTFRREEFLAGIAWEWRKADGRYLRADFNVVSFFEAVLQKRLPHKKGKLHIEFFDMAEGEPPAYVTPDPLTLHVDREIWHLANIGEPFARYIIAHEVGHIVLHGHYEKAAFSNDVQSRLKIVVKYNSAEWQANTFADYFLVPNDYVSETDTPKDISVKCNVPLDVAERRWTEVREERIKKKFNKDYCNNCGQLGCAIDH